MEEANNLLALLNNEEVLSKLKKIIESKEDYRKEKEEIKRLKTQLEEKEKEIESLKKQLSESSTNRLVDEIFKNFPAYAIFVGTDGKIKYVNNNTVKLTGFESPDEIIGLKPTELARIHPDYKEAGKILIDAVKNKKRLEGLEAKIVARNGVEFFAHIFLYPVYVDGQFMGYTEILYDIDEIKKKEEELKETIAEIQAITHGIPDAFFVVDKDRRIISWSKQAEKITGYTSGEAIGRMTKELFQISEECDVCKVIMKAMESKDAVLDAEGTIMTARGPIPALVSASPRIVDGEVKGAIVFIKDLTEMKAKERELEEIINKLPVALFIIDKDHRVKMWNKAAEILTGVKAEEVVGTNKQWMAFYKKERPVLADIVLDNPRDADRYYDVVTKSEVGDNVYKVETWIDTRSGDRRYVRATAAPIHDPEGGIIGVVETVEDMTELKEKEKEVQKVLDFVNELFKELPYPAYVLYADANHRIVYANDALAKLAGYESADEITGMRPSELFRTEGRKTIVDKVIESGQAIINYEGVTRTATGKEIPVLVSCVPIRDENGNLLGALDVFIDITNVKEKEKEVQRVLDFINRLFKELPYPAYVVYVDANHRIVYANDAVAKFCGFEKAEDVLGMTPSELFRTEGGKAIADKVIETGKAIINYEGVTRTASGKEIPVLVSCVPIRDGNGNLLGALDVFVDITNVKEKEEEIMKTLEYTEKALELLEEGVRELQAGNLSARVKKPERVEGVKITERFEETVDVFNEFAERLNDIIKKLAEDMKETNSQINEANEAVNQLNAGMQQISSASQQIATGSENLSRLANASAADLKAAEGVFKDLAKKADESSKFAESAVEGAETSKELGMKALQAMENIMKEIEKATEVVETLDDAVRNIGKITERIKSIADQTNLLALNAAIEAARAGEHGRGFAVVADEIRKLAEESRKSTEEIDEIVRKVQEETKKVIEATMNVKGRGEEGSLSIQDALTKSNEIAESISRINDMLRAVREAAENGLARIENLAKNFEEVASTAEENAASSEETSAAIEEQTAAVQQITTAMEKVRQIAEETTRTLLENFKVFDSAGMEITEKYATTLANGGRKSS